MESELCTAPVLALQPSEVEGLVEELQSYHAIFSPLFQRREQREWSRLYLQGLLTSPGRKSVEPMVLSLLGADAAAVRGMQAFLSAGAWSDEAILHRHWQEVGQTLGEAEGVLIVDGSDFPKQGGESVGVQRQYCGEVGKRANCQAGVFVGYASCRGYTLLDRRLYLPQAWFEQAQAERRQRCGVPETVSFQTKPALALERLQAQGQAGAVPARWVTCDEAFGQDPAFLDGVAACGLWYLAEVPHSTRLWRTRPATGMPERARRGPAACRSRVLPSEAPAQTVAQWAAALPAWAWWPLRLKEGSQGPMVAEVTALRLVAVRQRLPGPEVWLVLRRNPQSGELKAYLSNAPLDTPLHTFARISAMRWPIETCFEQSKQDLGLGDYEVRTWRGWHHHMTLCLLAHHFLVRVQVRLKKSLPC